MRHSITERERGWPSRIFKPETITKAKIPESFSNKTRENWADQGTPFRFLRNTTGPEVNIIWSSIDSRIAGESFVGEDSDEIVPRSGSFEIAELSVSVVTANTVFPTSLHVHRGQIRAELVLCFLEEMIGQLDAKIVIKIK